MCIFIVFLCIHVTGCGLLAIDRVHNILMITPTINIYANLSMLCNYSYSIPQAAMMMTLLSFLCSSVLPASELPSILFWQFLFLTHLTIIQNLADWASMHWAFLSQVIWITCLVKWIVRNVLSALSFPSIAKGSRYFSRWLDNDMIINTIYRYPTQRDCD